MTGGTTPDKNLLTGHWITGYDRDRDFFATVRGRVLTTRPHQSRHYPY